MKFLLMPNDMGGGGGHFFRMVALADKLLQAGHQPLFIVHQKKFARYLELKNIRYKRLLTGFWNIKQIVTGYAPRPLNKKAYREAIFWEIPDLSYQVIRDGIWSLQELNRRMLIIEHQIQLWRPECIISDGHLLAGIIGKKMSIPVVQIARKISFPETSSLLWWKNEANYKFPDLSVLFPNGALNGVSVNKLLFSADKLLIPSYYPLEPYEGSVPHLYCGALIRYPFPKLDKASKRDVIYITSGSGAKKNNLVLLLPVIEYVQKHTDCKIVISDPYHYFHKMIPVSDKLTIQDWVDNAAIMKQTRLVISHGGYGTMMDAFVHGVPSIIVPFHSEQEGNGRSIVRSGMGMLHLLHDLNLEKLKFNWKFGEFEMGISTRSTPSYESMFDHIESLLADSEHYIDQSNSIRKDVEDSLIINFIKDW
ncbi:MAG: hypothetical protein Kow00108_00580 [Calditrichia bacterium]